MPPLKLPMRSQNGRTDAGLRNSKPRLTTQGRVTAAAAVLLRVVETGESPHRLILGSDCCGAVMGKLDALKAEHSVWKNVSRSTDFAS